MKKSDKMNFEKEYTKIFSDLNTNCENIPHEWNKEGDSIKKFSLYKKYPTPILTQNTFQINEKCQTGERY